MGRSPGLGVHHEFQLPQACTTAPCGMSTPAVETSNCTTAGGPMWFEPAMPLAKPDGSCASSHIAAKAM